MEKIKENRINVGIVMGGISQEREISMLTGREIMKNIDKDKYHVKEIEIKKSTDVIKKCKDIDIVFIALHGDGGENGEIQCILESMGKKYTGTGVRGSFLCMDKYITKQILLENNIKSPSGLLIYREKNMKKIIEEIEREKINFPMIVKPVNGGSSIGVSFVENISELEREIKKIKDCNILIEEYIQGVEITVSMLGGKVLPILKLSSQEKYLDYDLKYLSPGKSIEELNEDGELIEKIHFIAKKCWDIFNLSIYGRIDMIIRNDDIYILEINSLPGMTEKSLFPLSAQVAGMSYRELIDDILMESYYIMGE